MEPPAGRDPDDAQGRACSPLFRGDAATPTRRTTCAASTTATAPSTGVAADSTTETYAALRLEIDNWRWSGVPFFIRTGKRLPVTQTELRLVFKRPAAAGLPARRRRAARSPTSSSIKLDPTTGIRLLRRRAARPTRRRPSRSPSTWSSPSEGGEGPTPVRGAAARRAWSATAPASPARTASRRPGGSCSRCSTRRRRSTRYAPGSWGPAAADDLSRATARWHGPWVAS